MSAQKYTLAIDLGGTNAKLALVSKEQEIFKEISLATYAESGPLAACQRWINAIKDWRQNDQIDLVGIGAPALWILKEAKY